MEAWKRAFFVAMLTVGLAVGCNGEVAEPEPIEEAAVEDEPQAEAPQLRQLPEVDPSTLPDGFPVAKLQVKPINNWSRALLDTYPAILACLAHPDLPGDALVARAWKMNETQTATRLSGRDGTKWHCQADADGGNPELMPMGVDASGALAGDVFFTPEDRERPAGDEFVHESVIDFEAEFLGWLSTRKQ